MAFEGTRQWVSDNPKKTSAGVIIGILILTIIIMAIVWALMYQRNEDEDPDAVKDGGKCDKKTKCVKGSSCVDGKCTPDEEDAPEEEEDEEEEPAPPSKPATTKPAPPATKPGGLTSTTNPSAAKYKSCPTVLSGASCEWKDYETWAKDGTCFSKYRDAPRCGESEAKAQCLKFGTWVQDGNAYLCKQEGGRPSGSIEATGTGGSSGGGSTSGSSSGSPSPPVNSCTISDIIKSGATCGWTNSGPNKCSAAPVAEYCTAVNARQECNGSWLQEGDKYGCSKTKVNTPCTISGVTIGNYRWKDDETCTVLKTQNTEFNACCNETSDGFCDLKFAPTTPSATIQNWITQCKARTIAAANPEPVKLENGALCTGHEKCKSGNCKWSGSMFKCAP
jgi:hypothetical protein